MITESNASLAGETYPCDACMNPVLSSTDTDCGTPC